MNAGSLEAEMRLFEPTSKRRECSASSPSGWAGLMPSAGVGVTCARATLVTVRQCCRCFQPLKAEASTHTASCTYSRMSTKRMAVFGRTRTESIVSPVSGWIRVLFTKTPTAAPISAPISWDNLLTSQACSQDLHPSRKASQPCSLDP